MRVAFVANVGSRDVQVDGHPNLPKDSRTLGEHILNNWDALRPSLNFQILMKALNYVLRQHQTLDAVVLFASDQPEGSQYRHTDTMPFAHVISRYIREELGDALADKIVLVTIAGNPANYDDMLGFYEPKLNALAQMDTVYLHVTGGTPAMSFMLLWQGVNVLGRKAHPLYVLQETNMPLTLRIGNTLMVKALVDDILDAVHTYQYHAAETILEKNITVLNEVMPHDTYALVSKLVLHARHRRNFRFDEAEAALMGADRYAVGDRSSMVLALMDDIYNRDEVWVMREEYFAAEVAAENGAYRYMLSHLFGFVEELLRQYVLKLGVQIDDKGKLVEAWLDRIPDLKTYLADKKVRLDRGANTFVMDLIVNFYAKQNPKLKQERKSMSNVLERLRPLRNASTHNHAGVSKADIEAAYKKPLDDLLADARQLYTGFADEPIAENPYNRINALIAQLLEPHA